MDPSGLKRKGGLIPVTSLKKQKGQDGKACFFCGGRGDLRCPSEEGKDRIIEAAKERQRLNDKASSSIIEKYFQEMDKISRNLNIIASATVTLLTKAKLKDLERNTKKVKENSMKEKLQERNADHRDVVIESML